jgi:hypothetical protein
MQKGPGISQSQDNTKNARIEGINELMLQAKVPENHGRLEVVPRALNLTKSPRHLTQCVTRPNCLQMPPHALTLRSCTSYRELAALHRDEVPHLSKLLHLDESTNSVYDNIPFPKFEVPPASCCAARPYLRYVNPKGLNSSR